MGDYSATHSTRIVGNPTVNITRSDKSFRWEISVLVYLKIESRIKISSEAKKHASFSTWTDQNIYESCQQLKQITLLIFLYCNLKIGSYASKNHGKLLGSTVRRFLIVRSVERPASARGWTWLLFGGYWCYSDFEHQGQDVGEQA